jgi:Ca2+:H+ antiporter
MLTLGTTFGTIVILVPVRGMVIVSSLDAHIGQTIIFTGAHDEQIANLIKLKLSRAISVVLLLVYVVSIAAQIQTALRLEQDASATNIGEEDEARPFMAYEDSPLEQLPPARYAEHELVVREPFLTGRTKLLLPIMVLATSAGLASICAGNMVSAVEHVLAHTPLTETFLGLVLFPLLSNTTELGTAVAVAMTNQIDLAVNVSIGSANQIALFMAPLMVLLGWGSHNGLALLFRPFETVALVVTMALVAIVVTFTCGHYGGGAILIFCYVVLW